MKTVVALGFGGLLVAFLGGCGSGKKAVEEPTISPETVPSLSLLSGSRVRGEEVSSSGAGESCEQVSTDERQRAREQGAGEEAPDEHAQEITEVLNNGSYLNGCGVAETSGIELCVAVIQGEARGVTVWVKPGTTGQADCIADEIRKLSFPVHELVSIARTNFDPG